jgi:hypothetical protein
LFYQFNPEPLAQTWLPWLIVEHLGYCRHSNDGNAW